MPECERVEQGKGASGGQGQLLFLDEGEQGVKGVGVELSAPAGHHLRQRLLDAQCPATGVKRQSQS
jgi:hypothetical protein